MTRDPGELVTVLKGDQIVTIADRFAFGEKYDMELRRNVPVCGFWTPVSLIKGETYAVRRASAPSLAIRILMCPVGATQGRPVRVTARVVEELAGEGDGEPAPR